MEENKQHFWQIMLCYFKKGKNATEMQKKKREKFVQHMEKVLWLIECVRSGLCTGDSSLDEAPRLVRPGEDASN